MAFLGLLSWILLLPGCKNKEEIAAAIWFTSPIPLQICTQVQGLSEYGFYRKIVTENGEQKWEFMSFCDQNSKHWLAIYDADLEKILDASLPKPLVAHILGNSKLTDLPPETPPATPLRAILPVDKE